MKKLIIIQSVGSMFCVTLAMLLSAALANSFFVFVELSIVLSTIFVFIFTGFHFTAYDDATLNLKTGNFKAGSDFKDRHNEFILLTKVIPFETETTNKKENE